MRLKTLILLAFIVLGGAAGVIAQSGKGTPGGGGKANRRPPAAKPTPPQTTGEEAGEIDGPEIVVDTKLVTIPVRVMDRRGRFLPGLSRENFKVFEDGVEQEIALFSNDAQPFTVALVLDMSYSAKFKAAEIQTAAIEFIDQLRPDDKVIVIAFDEEVHLLCEPTSDRKTIYGAIRRTKISTGTSLYEAVDLTINDRLKKIEGRKAMVLFTDGVDTSSRRANDLDNLRDAMETDSIIYPIRYDTYADVQRIKNNPTAQTIPIGGTGLPTGGPPAGSTPPIVPGSDKKIGLPFPLPTAGVGTPSDKGTTQEEYARGEEYLNQLAIRSGGRIFVADTLGNLSSAFAKIASELREFYGLGYYPNDETGRGTVRKVKVKVDQPNAAVKARDSYVVGQTRER